MTTSNSTAMDRLRQLPGFRACGKDQYEARCPAHDDHKASLSISIADGKILLHCHAGCETEKILQSLGLSSRDLFANENSNGYQQAERRIVATYDYRTADNKLSYQVVRFDPKDFRQRQPDGKGGWKWTTKGLKRLPYNLEDLSQSEYAFVVEGEKDVESLRSIGLVGTCNSGGAEKWTEELSQYFRLDQYVTIIPDNDDPGRKHAEQVANYLSGKVASIKILELPGLPPKGDLSDWLKRSDPEAAAEALCQLSEAAPEWKSSTFEDTDPWKESIFTLADAYRERPAREYLVEELFSIPSLSIVYGSPGCLKSALLADMAVCVAAGIPWLPHDAFDLRGKSTKQSPVLWADFDNGDITHNRFEAFARARNLSENLPLYYGIMPDPWLDATSEVHMAALTNRIEKMGIKLLIIDNLKMISGKLDENKPEMSTVMAHFRRLVDKLGIVLILLHHPPKADDEILRGHGSILAALDLSLHVRRDGTRDTISVKPVKVRGAMPASFGARFNYTHKPGSTELLTARFWKEGAQTGKPLSPAEQEVFLLCSRVDQITIAEVSGSVKKISPETARRALWSLASRGLINRIDHGGSGKTAVFQPVRNGFAHLVFDQPRNLDTCASDCRTPSRFAND